MNPLVANLLREDLRGRTPYGAPQLDVPVRLNTNENSYAVPDDVVTAIAAAVTDTARHLNRYPDREFTELREALAAYLRSQTGVGITPEQVWAGNGSNEVLLHLVQAFGGVGRTALGFTPAYSMHPIITRTTGTTWVDGLRGTPTGVFDLDAGPRCARSASTGRTSSSSARRTTRPAPPCPSTSSRPSSRRPRVAGRGGRGLRRVRPAGHAECHDPARGAGRCSSSPGP